MTEMYRMPIGFGPSLGPRQGPGGRRFTGEPIRTNLLTCAYRTDPDRLAAVLPAPFVPAPDPVVTVRVLHNLGFPWLAGRGYNYFEVLFRAVHRGAAGETLGDFVAVMWESMADPIIVGRDEAGHPKLFADVSAPHNIGGGVEVTASWEGFEFGRLRLDGASLGDWPHELEQTTAFADPAGATPLPRFNYKYFPSTTEPGKAAVGEVVMIPAGVYRQQVLTRWTGTGGVSWREARWEDLPTFAQVVNGLAALPQVEPLPASLTQLVKLTNDLRDELQLLH
ncbi:acetoacetate decarboxylase family protein [Dactylosporangium sucinum]|uniref:Acetoacetate decarboxylase n=1 Tax=Dactylosporangium sucinum TaxID=1424081 RepID=A0A917WQ80_9ACTN|nr:acetoacetate decarboxylase family protein [Dactylosporangium sucinum]GGM20761.1 hypothetical protein GCM10007977_022380 [Dactylosporangium sucinum]